MILHKDNPQRFTMHRASGRRMVTDWGYSDGGRLGRYYFSPYDQNEQTEWMKPVWEMDSGLGQEWKWNHR